METITQPLPAAAASPQPCARDLFSLAGQTIFQVIGANGAAMLLFESYPADVVVPGQWMDRSKAIRRSKDEFEAEQYSLRSADVATPQV